MTASGSTATAPIDAFATTLAGEAVQLLGARALFWPARSRLLIADLHLGKADTFRNAGIALPRGGSTHDLDRIGSLLEATGADALWVLGDLLHGALTDTHWRASWDDWRARHLATAIVVVDGNHDRALRRAGLDVQLAGDRVDDGPFTLCHAPASLPGRHVMCGHIHPVVSVPGVRRRWPAFWLRDGMTVLPAFSAFTGGELLHIEPASTIVACVEDAAIALPSGRPHA